MKNTPYRNSLVIFGNVQVLKNVKDRAVLNSTYLKMPCDKSETLVSCET
jgi:hypothetical protein